MGTRIVHATGTGNVGGAGGGSLRSVLLNAEGAAADIVVKQNGSGGSIILEMRAAAGTVSSHRFQGEARYSGQLHVTLTGAGATVTFEL